MLIQLRHRILSSLGRKRKRERNGRLEEVSSNGDASKDEQSQKITRYFEPLEEYQESLYVELKAAHVFVSKHIWWARDFCPVLEERLEAETILNQSKQLLHRLQRQHCKRPSLPLPDDVLLEIYHYLGTQELFACSRISRHWRDVTRLKPALWLQKVELRGSHRRIARQWEYILELQKRPAVATKMSICVDWGYPALDGVDHRFEPYDDDEDAQPPWLLDFIRTIPFKTLIAFDYKGEDWSFDVRIWFGLTKCEKLERLTFTSRDSFMNCRWEQRFNMLPPAPLSHCKLQHLDIDANLAISYGSFHCTQLKSLRLKTTLEADVLRSMLKGAAKSLEVVQIGPVEHVHSDDNAYCCSDEACYNYAREERIDDDDDVDDEVDYSHHKALLMPKLQRFRAVDIQLYHCCDERGSHHITKVNYHIAAPNMTEMIYEDFLGWDKKLFNSCSHNLDIVTLSVNKSNCQDIYKAISRLKACRKLELNLTRRYEEGGKRNAVIEVPSLFTGDYCNIKTTPWRALKALRTLSIVADEKLSGDELMKFIEYKRTSSDCVALRRLTLKSCGQMKPEAIEMLSRVPGLTLVRDEA